jgi:hypothetical protein
MNHGTALNAASVPTETWLFFHAETERETTIVLTLLRG